MPLAPSIAFVLMLMLTCTAHAQQTDGEQPAAAADASSPYWLNISLKARSMLVDPASGQLNEVMHHELQLGIPSPDGLRIAFLGSDPERVKAGQDFDVFVADIDPNQPSGKANIRRLTTDQIRPVETHWLPDSRGIIFVAGETPQSQIWFVDALAGAEPVRITEGTHRCYDLSVTPAGEIAYLVHKGSKQKAQFKDLMIRPAPIAAARGGKTPIRTPLQDQHVSSYAISPDGASLAWSGLGSMFIVNLETGASSEIPLNGIHPQLLNHSVYEFAWRPDGKVLAIQCGFLGGIARGMDADPNAPWPRMFAEDKVFFVPVDWRPTPESLIVTNETYPSPTADDPKAEVSPPAGDESKPWWVRETPMRPLGLQWVSAEDAQNRIARDAVPPGEEFKPESPRPMPPVPVIPPVR